MYILTNTSGGFFSLFASVPLLDPTPTPKLSKEYIYAGSRLLAVDDAGAQQPSATDLSGPRKLLLQIE
jgi:hypothetical protein